MNPLLYWFCRVVMWLNLIPWWRKGRVLRTADGKRVQGIVYRWSFTRRSMLGFKLLSNRLIWVYLAEADRRAARRKASKEDGS